MNPGMIYKSNIYSFNLQLSAIQANTLLRGTFNATLNNPVTISYDEIEQRTPSKQAFLLGV
jgi:hypothetical protein